MAEVLETAADLLKSERLGWIQGRFHDHINPDKFSDLNVIPGHEDLPVTQVCANGVVIAAQLVSGHGHNVQLTHNTLHKGISYQLVVTIQELAGVWSLWRWNDAKGRTKQEVIDLFDNMAKKLRNREITL